MFDFIEYLYNKQPHYNGHGQFHVEKMTIEDGLSIARSLQELDSGKHLFCVEVFASGGFSVVAKDWWNLNEHNLGHTTKTFLSVEEY